VSAIHDTKTITGTDTQPTPEPGWTRYEIQEADARLIRDALLRLGAQTDLPSVQERCARLADLFGEPGGWPNVANQGRKSGAVVVDQCERPGCPLPAGHNRGRADIPENHPPAGGA
jgi:hypothetical protein